MDSMMLSTDHGLSHERRTPHLQVEKAIIPITCTTRSGTQGPAHTPRATPDEVLPASAGHAASEAASQAASQPSPA